MGGGNSGDLSPVELNSVQTVLSTLQTAIKSYPLYPQDHIISQKQVASTFSTFTSHIDRFGDLQLEVDKKGLKYKGELVSAGLLTTDLLWPQLCRDGIEWIAFTKGVSSKELNTLIETLSRYRDLAEEPEADLVTCFWKADFQHFKYHAEEILLETVPPFSFDQFKINSTGGPEQATSVDGGNVTGHSDSGTNGSHLVEEQPLPEGNAIKSSTELIGNLSLSDDEKYSLRSMVISEESVDNTCDVIDVLMIVLQDLEDEQDFDALMKTLYSEFKKTLIAGNFRHAGRLLKILRIDKPELKNQDGYRIIDNFFKDVVNHEIASSIVLGINNIQDSDRETTFYLREIISVFPSTIIDVLLPLTSQIPSGTYRESVLEALGYHANSDFMLFEKVLTSCSDEVIAAAIPIFRLIKHERVVSLLFRLATTQPIAVQRKILKILSERDQSLLLKFFVLLDATNAETRQAYLFYLSKRRNGDIEKKLLQYLLEKEFTINESEHILACYAALGHCGSEKILPALKQNLFGQPIKDLLKPKGSRHRRGAAIALNLMKDPEADMLLARASKSIFPHVRFAVQFAEMYGRARVTK